MDAISLMVKEHENIKRMLKVIRKLSINILNGKEVDYDDFYKIIDFVRNYADKHHHNKEEVILFKKMEEELNATLVEGPLYGMYIEHDLGRLYMKNLEMAVSKVKDGDLDSRVDVIANAISYTDLLYRHINKENNAIYNFAQRQLSREGLLEVDKKCEEVEEEAVKVGKQDKYIGILKELENKVSISNS